MSDLAQLPETGTGRLRIDLVRRLAAEGLGTGLLVVAVVGSGIMASRLSPSDVGLQLLENAAATAAALIGLILIFGAVSGAHFNPVVTLVDRAFGTIRTAEATLYITAQVVGACLGTMVANLMFELPVVEWSTKSRSSSALWLSEVVATVDVAARHPRLRTHRSRERRAVRGGNLDRRRVLVHVVDQLREPCGHDRTHDVQHVRGHQAGLRADVHPHATRRRGHRLWPDPALLPDDRQRGAQFMSDTEDTPMDSTRHISDLPLDQQQMIRTARANVERDFAGTFGPETIERFIVDSLDRLMASAKVTAFLPLFTEKFTRERLRALARLEGLSPTTAPSVLFLCVHNAGRSQIAAGWLRHLGGDQVVVYSGGSEPESQINPAAIEAMAEVDIDIRAEFPKPWTEEIVRAADVVVTMGCGDACPLYPGKRYEDWELDDPAGLGVESVRPIRDEIRTRVEALMASLGVPMQRA